MGTIAARKAAEILQNVRRVLAIELFAAGQALSMLGPEKLAPATRAAYDALRVEVPFIERDVVMYEQIAKCERLVAEGGGARGGGSGLRPAERAGNGRRKGHDERRSTLGEDVFPAGRTAGNARVRPGHAPRAGQGLPPHECADAAGAQKRAAVCAGASP